MTHPTSAQYRLAVQVGLAVCDAFAEDATHDEVIATLKRCLAVAQANRDWPIPGRRFAAGEATTPAY